MTLFTIRGVLSHVSSPVRNITDWPISYSPLLGGCPGLCTVRFSSQYPATRADAVTGWLTKTGPRSRTVSLFCYSLVQHCREDVSLEASLTQSMVPVRTIQDSALDRTGS